MAVLGPVMAAVAEVVAVALELVAGPAVSQAAACHCRSSASGSASKTSGFGANGLRSSGAVSAQALFTLLPPVATSKGPWGPRSWGEAPTLAIPTPKFPRPLGA